MSAITKGSTHRFQLAATKDGVTWDLTAATVTLVLVDPSGNETNCSATVSSPSGGVAYYDTSTTDLDEVGTWQRVWKIVQSSVTMWSVRTNFHVSRGA